MERFGAILLLAAAFVGTVQAAGPRQVSVDKAFDGKKGEAATDLSGIACAPGPLPQQCLVVNDESKVAQRVSYDGTQLLVGATIALESPAKPLGTPPIDTVSDGTSIIACSNKDDGDKYKFKEFDGEGVAIDGTGKFYVAGSHGCSRKKAKYVPSAFLLTQVDTASGKVVNSFRLVEVLRGTPAIAASFGRDLVPADGKAVRGINIEGIAVAGPKLLVGLRSPAADGKAIVLVTPLAPLFTAESTIGAAVVYELPVGTGAGVRDLTISGDVLLVLTGPADDTQVTVPFKVWAAPASNPAEVRPVITLDGIPMDISGAQASKPEAILAVGTPAKPKLLVLADSAINGSPLEYDLPAVAK